MLRALHTTSPEKPAQIIGRILSADPMITLSKRDPRSPLGIAGVEKDFFRKKQALHIVSDTWHFRHERRSRGISKALRRLSNYLVDNHFIFLGNTTYETLLLSGCNIPSICSSELIAVDETVFSPEAGPPAGFEPAEAVYVARLVPLKRHELARDLPNVALAYSHAKFDPQIYEQMKQAMPHFRFINHELGKGNYYHLSSREVAGVLNACEVGLCLSGNEGAMRASMEYLMCGLPVVATRCPGGRERYFDSDNCIFADDTPAAVADAVREAVRRKSDRSEIRRSTLQKVKFDRMDFVSTINEIIASIYGIHDFFESYSRFTGYMEYRPVKDVMNELATF